MAVWTSSFGTFNTDGRILGFVLALIESGSDAHIITLDVIPEARQQKIATRLMNEIHNELKKEGISVIFLEVGVNNLPAQCLYRGLHYQYIETLAGYYRGREDAYRMARFA